jgi:predicted PurR-regulated permease PerM
MSFPKEISRVERWLLSVALIFIIVIALKMISFIVTLFMMSLILTLLCQPAVSWLKQRGLSAFPATVIIAFIGFLIVLGFFFFTMLSFNSLVASLPQYQTELNTRMNDMNTILDNYGISISTDGPPSIKLGDIMQYGYTGFISILEAVEFLFFVGVTTFFLLLDAPRLGSRLEEFFGKDSESVRQMSLLTGSQGGVHRAGGRRS